MLFSAKDFGKAVKYNLRQETSQSEPDAISPAYATRQGKGGKEGPVNKPIYIWKDVTGVLVALYSPLFPRK